MTENELRASLRASLSKRGEARAWAKAHGISEAYLSDYLRGRRGAGEKIASAMGLVRVVTYREPTMLPTPFWNDLRPKGSTDA